jgi:U3 small nucleolar RNA-associated protein 10
LLKTFLPFHSIPAFATLLSIIPKLPTEFRFLDPYVRALICPPRSVFVHQAVQHPDFLSLVSEYTIESCRVHFQHPAQITFWGGLVTEAISGILDRTKSGRAAVQKDNEQALLHRVGPIFAESLVMKKVPSLQIASYMALAVFVAKGNLEDVAVTAFMEQLVYGWTNDTVRPGIVALSIMAQHRSAKQMSGRVTKALVKVSEIGALLVEIGQDRRVDKLANGLCLALIERLSKKGDPRGLTTIITILSGRILREKQIAVIFKSLLLTAHKLNDNNDENGVLRRELGSALISSTRIPGEPGEIIQTVIREVEFDIEELEMKLDLSFRSRKLQETASDEKQIANGVETTPQALEVAITELAARDEPLSSCLVPDPKEIFDEFSHLFFSIVSQQNKGSSLLAQFEAAPQLKRETALEDPTYCSFFIRIWCGPYPALARAAALDAVKNLVKSKTGARTDVQALIPYGVAALGDPSKRVRQSAAHLITVLADTYASLGSAKGVSTWAAGSLYGKSLKFATVAPGEAAQVLHLQILPTLEECVMDPGHISVVLANSIETGKFQTTTDGAPSKKDQLSSSSRLAVLSFFAGHIVATPLLLVRYQLLKSLNQVRGVSGTTRTKVLLPVLQWWSGLTDEEAKARCALEKLDPSTVDASFVDVIVGTEIGGIEYLFEILKDHGKKQREGLIGAIFARIRKIWPSLKDDVQFMVAEQLLELSQDQIDSDETDNMVATEAADLLRNVDLTTHILSFFLDSIKTGTKIVTEPPPNKRRRTSSGEESRGLVTQASVELSQALRKVTFVLQVVESSNPIAHPELLDGLFTALSELQHFRTVVGSELGYLQNLILRSLLAMMPAYKSDKSLKINSSGGYGDLLVTCIQKSSSPVVQNAALLLIANLASTAPNLVLHSVMPTFTFMGSSVLRQSDDYSTHVVSQTIKQVIPPLIDSLRQGKKNPIAGASEILVSFSTAYEHIPAHRRLDLFVALVETLGPSDFLFALTSMLVDRYGPSDALLQFIVDLMNTFKIEVQLGSLIKLLDLINDLFEPKPDISFTLLGISDDGEQKDIKQVALRQLTAFPTFLSSKKLKAEISELVKTDDMEASEVRRQYAGLLEGILVFSDRVKTDNALHSRCGSALSNLLNLLSIGDYIKVVEDLLSRPSMGLRQKVLRSLEGRVDREKNTDADSRAALLAFLPQLTAAIRDSDDIRYKHTAVTCVDKIAEKYGKKDIEAVVAAAETIAGEHCLGESDRRLRVMALLCLSSLVDVLQEAVVPVLPLAIPRAVVYLRDSLQGDEVDEQLHTACYGLISSLAEHLPYMLSTYLDQVLQTSYLSAEAGLSTETNESRVSCLILLAKRIEAKEMFTSLDKNWDHAMSAGFTVRISTAISKGIVANAVQAVTEHIDVLGQAIEKHSKGSISKNSALLAQILTKAFDLRRQKHGDDTSATTLEHISSIERSLNEKALKMIYKLNDASFRPIFTQFVEWTDAGLGKKDREARTLRRFSMYGFFESFFDGLKSIVTNYATYIVDDAVKVLGSLDLKSAEQKQLWSRVLSTLAKCFEHDQDDFWQAPSHFGAVAPVLLEQFLHAPSASVDAELFPCVVELAAAADSQAHQKELNSGLLKHLRSENRAVRLAAVKCEQALADRLGEEWLSMLHEMLPRISELQEDDDEEVERETHRWIVKIEGVLGESLDAMLQ